jgi:hypothetical protein
MGGRFLIAALAALLGVAAARRLDLVSIGWPAYLVFANTTIGLVALRGRRTPGALAGGAP